MTYPFSDSFPNGETAEKTFQGAMDSSTTKVNGSGISESGSGAEWSAVSDSWEYLSNKYTVVLKRSHSAGSEADALTLFNNFKTGLKEVKTGIAHKLNSDQSEETDKSIILYEEPEPVTKAPVSDFATSTGLSYLAITAASLSLLVF
jgi:hypothetical protein